MALEGAIHPDDTVVEESGIKFVLDRQSAATMGGVRIDFEAGPYGGFSVLSDRYPSSSSCG